MNLVELTILVVDLVEKLKEVLVEEGRCYCWNEKVTDVIAKACVDWMTNSMTTRVLVLVLALVQASVIETAIVIAGTNWEAPQVYEQTQTA